MIRNITVSINKNRDIEFNAKQAKVVSNVLYENLPKEMFDALLIEMLDRHRREFGK